MAFDYRKISLRQTKKKKTRHSWREKFYILIWEVDTWMYTNVKIHQAAYLRYVNLTICKLYVSKKHFWYRILHITMRN